MSDLHKEIINILNGQLLTPHFQPIVSLTTKASKNSKSQLQCSAEKL
ncbi:MAG: hypothetical protein RIQ94_3025 [Pseudomonadota bacterium]|jgi:hypothetical protein